MTIWYFVPVLQPKKSIYDLEQMCKRFYDLGAPIWPDQDLFQACVMTLSKQQKKHARVGFYPHRTESSYLMAGNQQQRNWEKILFHLLLYLFIFFFYIFT